ncbi:hypothetical protein HY251_08765 [bacterium]|nr:hypothetical protein [bacterium]
MPFRVRALDELDPTAEAVFGGKSCGLARLLAAGARVPSGFAVAATRDGPETWAEADRVAFLGALAPLLEGGPVAVRSSAVGEDGAVRSFAGLFETVLGVAGVDGALAAATRCIESASSARVRAYAGEGAQVPMGLVVQRMVAARASGVCFTRDPGGRDRAALVEAVSGSGDALVSGRVQPERWRVYRTGLGTQEPRREEGPVPVLAGTDAARIAGRPRASPRGSELRSTSSGRSTERGTSGGSRRARSRRRRRSSSSRSTARAARRTTGRSRSGREATSARLSPTPSSRSSGASSATRCSLTWSTTCTGCRSGRLFSATSSCSIGSREGCSSA